MDEALTRYLGEGTAAIRTTVAHYLQDENIHIASAVLGKRRRKLPRTFQKREFKLSTHSFSYHDPKLGYLGDALASVPLYLIQGGAQVSGRVFTIQLGPSPDQIEREFEIQAKNSEQAMVKMSFILFIYFFLGGGSYFLRFVSSSLASIYVYVYIVICVLLICFIQFLFFTNSHATTWFF